MRTGIFTTPLTEIKWYHSCSQNTQPFHTVARIVCSFPNGTLVAFMESQICCLSFYPHGPLPYFLMVSLVYHIWISSTSTCLPFTWLTLFIRHYLVPSVLQQKSKVSSFSCNWVVFQCVDGLLICHWTLGSFQMVTAVNNMARK